MEQAVVAPYSLRDYLSPRGVSRAEEKKMLESLTKNNRGFDGGVYAQGTSSAHKKSTSEIRETTSTSPTISLSGISPTASSQAVLEEPPVRGAPVRQPAPSPTLKFHSPSLSPAQKTVRFPLKELRSAPPKSEVLEAGQASHTPTPKTNRFSLKDLGSSFPRSEVAGTGLQAAATASQAGASTVTPIPDPPTLAEPLSSTAPSTPSVPPAPPTPAPPTPAASVGTGLQAAATASQAGGLAVTPLPVSHSLAESLPAASAEAVSVPSLPPAAPSPRLTATSLLATPGADSATGTRDAASGRNMPSSSTQTDSDSAEDSATGARSTASGSSWVSSSTQTDRFSAVADSDSEDSDSDSEGFASAKDIGRILDAHCSRRIALDTNSKVCLERMFSEARELRRRRTGWLTTPSLYFKNLNRPNRKLCDYDVCELEAFRHQRVFKVVEGDEGQETLQLEDSADCSDAAKASLQDYSCNVWFLPEFSKYLWTKVVSISKQSLRSALMPLGRMGAYYLPFVPSLLNAFAGIAMPVLKAFGVLLPRFELEACKDGEYTVDGIAVFIPSAVVSCVFVLLFVSLMKTFSAYPFLAATSGIPTAVAENTIQPVLASLGNASNATTSAGLLGTAWNAIASVNTSLVASIILGNELQKGATNESLGNVSNTTTSLAPQEARKGILDVSKVLYDATPSAKYLAEVQRRVLEATVNMTEQFGTLLRNITSNASTGSFPAKDSQDHRSATNFDNVTESHNFTESFTTFISNVTEAALDVGYTAVVTILPALSPVDFQGYLNAVQKRSLRPLLDWYRRSGEKSWSEIKTAIKLKMLKFEQYRPILTDLMKKLKELKEAYWDKTKTAERDEPSDLFGWLKTSLSAAMTSLENVGEHISEHVSGIFAGTKHTALKTLDAFDSNKQSASTELLSAFTATIMTDVVFKIFTKIHEFITCELAKRMLRAYRGYKLSNLSD